MHRRYAFIMTQVLKYLSFYLLSKESMQCKVKLTFWRYLSKVYLTLRRKTLLKMRK